MKTRNYGIDLFRILSMFMVVALHIGGVSGALQEAPASGVYECGWLLRSACYGAVNCYALISGYVGVNSKFKYSNIVYLWLQVVFLTVILQGAWYIVDPTAFSLGKTIMCFFPVFGRSYWYFTDYFLLFFFIPLLNTAIRNTPKNLLRSLLIVLSILFCASILVPLPGLAANPFNLQDGYSLLWLALLYLIGAYMATHKPFLTIKKRTFLCVYILCTLITCGSKLLLERMPDGIKTLFPSVTFVSYLSPFLLIGSIALLLLFSRLEGLPKWLVACVKFISPLCFGIYITHVHPFLFGIIEQRVGFVCDYSTPVFVVLLLGVSVTVFGVSMLIDAVRFYIFKWFNVKERLLKLESKWLHNHC